MSELFRRSYRLVINDVAIERLSIAFDIERTLKKQPNTAAIRVHNLNSDNRQKIEERGKATVVLEAGYEVPEGVESKGFAPRSLIYKGDLREVHTEPEGADLVTIMESGDGEEKHRKARVQKNFGPGTRLIDVLRACANAMGVGLGNLSAIKSAEFPKVGAVFPCGTTLSGSAAQELDGILRSAGLEYSIQNGALQIQTRRQAIKGTAVSLTPETGLVGQASITSDLTLHAECLMIPDIFPGRRIKVQSSKLFQDVLNIQSRGRGTKYLEGFTGFFRVNKAKYIGDSFGNEWNIKIEGEPLFRPET